jgi:anti-sigma regulatory factor (Ser/Thr protein kinase)
MTGQWPLRSSLQLGALPTAVACARLHARLVLREWGLQSAADTAELLISELTTNGITAAREMPEQRHVDLRLSANGKRVLIEVWDGNTQPPALGELDDEHPSLSAEGGRGLFLVATLSTRWDWHLTQEPEGKVVWCMLLSQPLRPTRRLLLGWWRRR